MYHLQSLWSKKCLSKYEEGTKPHSTDEERCQLPNFRAHASKLLRKCNYYFSIVIYYNLKLPCISSFQNTCIPVRYLNWSVKCKANETASVAFWGYVNLEPDSAQGFDISYEINPKFKGISCYSRCQQVFYVVTQTVASKRQKRQNPLFNKRTSYLSKSFRLQNYSGPGLALPFFSFSIFCRLAIAFSRCGEGDVSVLHRSVLTVELGRKNRSCVELLCDSLVLSSQTSLLHQCYCDQPVCPKWYWNLSQVWIAQSHFWKGYNQYDLVYHCSFWNDRKFSCDLFTGTIQPFKTLILRHFLEIAAINSGLTSYLVRGPSWWKAEPEHSPLSRALYHGKSCRDALGIASAGKCSGPSVCRTVLNYRSA